MEEKKQKPAGTFVIHIHCCENATWQGEVVWTEKNKKKNFRSALELLKLLDSAMNLPGGEEEQTETEI